MKRIATTLCLFLATGLPAYSAPPASSSDKPTDSKPAAHQSHDDAYLGVLVMPMHPGFASHLKGMISRGQGLMVAEVAPDSPAAKAEIKTHDILVAFDDQKLFSAEQMAKLIHADKPGREVTVELIRDGQSQKVKATLGKLDHRRHNEWMQAMEEQAHHGHLNRFHHSADSHEPEATEWNDFDSLTLKKLADNKFRVEVQYLGKDNKNHKHQFEGTREEIRKAIRTEQDLKPAERAHLIRSLNMNTSDESFFGPGRFRSNDQQEGT